MLCDLCIIQLNVAYQFKTLAVELDAKHQQYIIENGVNSSPNSDNSALQSIEQRTIERSATTLRPLTFPVSLSNLQHRRLIKSEPTDYENMSDITIDTNTDLLEDFSRNGVNSSASNQPFGTSNMVCVSDLDLLRSNGDSDIEFINNCLQPSVTFRHFETPANTVGSHQSTTTTTTTTIASQLVIAASKSMNKNLNPLSDRRKPQESSNLAKDLTRTQTSSSQGKRKVKTKMNVSDTELKKTLRPKSNDNINYSLVKRRKHRLINPANKVRQMIKEENESIKQSAGKTIQGGTVNNNRTVNLKHSSMLRKKRKPEEKNTAHFRRGQHNTNKGQYHEKLNMNRRITIKDTDRFKFASIKTIKSVTATRN